MSKINIAFAFDYNFYRQAVVAVSSLLDCAQNKVAYNIYCLIKADVTLKEQKEVIKAVKKRSKESQVFFIDTEKYFNDAYECRGISKSAYSRLLLHKLISEEKIIYSDVDVLFYNDLSEIYNVDISNYCIGAVRDIILNLSSRRRELEQQYDYWREDLKKIKKNYFNSGFLLMNLKQIRKLHFWDNELETLIKRTFNYQDQDILNILFKDRQKEVFKVSPRYLVLSGGFPQNYQRALQEGIITKQDYDDVTSAPAIIHYAGRKPWDFPTINMADQWWNYVKKSTPYFKYFIKRLPDELRPLGRWKKIRNYFQGWVKKLSDRLQDKWTKLKCFMFSYGKTNKHRMIKIFGIKIKIRNK